MEKAKLIETPLPSHISLSKYQSSQSKKEREYMKKVPYANAVGSVMYIMVCCRLDIAYAMSLVSRYMANPGKEHQKELKWILRYLQGTRDYGLVFGGQPGGYKKNSRESYGGSDPLEVFVDANYASDLDIRRSTRGTSFVCLVDQYLGDQSFNLLQPCPLQRLSIQGLQRL